MQRWDMALKGDVSTSHHLLTSQLCCLEADYVMFRDNSLLPLHQALFLGGWPGGLLCIWEAPSLQAAPNQKRVRAGYAPDPNKSSIDYAADTEVPPISVDPASRLCFLGVADHWHLHLSSAPQPLLTWADTSPQGAPFLVYLQ